jgi:hypothetical protein
MVRSKLRQVAVTIANAKWTNFHAVRIAAGIPAPVALAAVGDGGAQGGQNDGNCGRRACAIPRDLHAAARKTADFLDNGISRRAADGDWEPVIGAAVAVGASAMPALLRILIMINLVLGGNCMSQADEKACHPQCFEGRFGKVFNAKYVHKGEQGRR